MSPLNIIQQNKLALNPFDNKRYIFQDDINTLAYEHSKIKTEKIRKN